MALYVYLKKNVYLQILDLKGSRVSKYIRQFCNTLSQEQFIFMS